MTKEDIAAEFKRIQESICAQIAEVDGKANFQSDVWKRGEGGGGDTRILQDGDVWEKAGVNFSQVHGPVSEKMMHSFKFPEGDFFATGVSIVMHPRNPYIPIIHMNIRYFELDAENWWFGGGIDLTPIYVEEEEAQLFHQQLKATCDKHDVGFYPKYKAWADDYFFIPHRGETRGIGGIFFDRLSCPASEKGRLFDFVKDVGQLFAPLYTQIVQRKRNRIYNQENKNWQSIRRSRYVEFNLIYDKGTRFGLESGGRTESILMSLPPMAEWHYNYAPQANSEELRTLQLLKKGKAWI